MPATITPDAPTADPDNYDAYRRMLFEAVHRHAGTVVLRRRE
jgi:hypothetical protein